MHYLTLPTFAASLVLAATAFTLPPSYPGYDPKHHGSHPPGHHGLGEVGDISLPLHPDPVYFFPGIKHKIEALVPRPNGQFLVSSAIPPRMYQIDPTNSTPPILVHEFPGGQHGDMFGIAEVQHDVFYTAVGKVLQADLIVPGSYVVYKVDMNTFKADHTGKVLSPATVTKFTDIPEAKCLNGFTSVYDVTRPPPNFFLVGDCFDGVLWRFDTETAKYQIAGNETTFKPVSPKKGGSEFLGLNGLKVQDGYLWYTNSALSKMFRIPIRKDGFIPHGAKSELIASDLLADDFAIDAFTKYAYVAGTLTTNVVYRVDLESGRVEILSGVFNSTSSPLKTPTAVQFGRSKPDRKSIFVTVDGGNPKSIPGTQGVVKFDVDDFSRPFVF